MATLLVGMLSFLAGHTGGSIHPPPLMTLAHEKTVADMAFSPGGMLLAVVSKSSRKIFLWELPSGKVRTIWNHPVEGTGLAWSADGGHLAIAGIDGSLHVYDLQSGQSRLLHPGGMAGKLTLHQNGMLPGGSLLATGHVDDDPNLCRVRIWDLTTGKERCSWATQTLEHVYVLAAPDGHTVLTVELPSGRMTAWAWRTGKRLGHFVVKSVQPANPPLAITLAPGMNTLVAGSGSSHDLSAVKRWVIPTREQWPLLGEKRYLGTIHDLAVTPDGMWLAVSLSEKPRRLTLDKIAKVVNKLDNPDRKTPIPDDHLLRFWNLANGKPIAQVHGTRPMRLVRIDPSNRFVTASQGELLFVWSLPPLLHGGSVR